MIKELKITFLDLSPYKETDIIGNFLLENMKPKTEYIVAVGKGLEIPKELVSEEGFAIIGEFDLYAPTLFDLMDQENVSEHETYRLGDLEFINNGFSVFYEKSI